MENQSIEISVVVPVFNSEMLITELVTKIVSALQSTKQSFEIVLVNDFSFDNSWEKLQEVKSQFSERIKIINLAKNYGQHSATFCGLKFATGNYVVTIDDDLQNDPSDIRALYKEITSKNLELVYGISDAKTSVVKKAGSKVYKWGSRNVDNGLGYGSSFRIFTSDLKGKIISHQQHFIFLDELLYWYTNFIEFVTVTHYPRTGGSSGHTTKKLFNLFFSTTLNYGTWHLKLMVAGGVALSSLSILMALFFILKKVIFGSNIPGYTSIIVTILFSTSLILICFGILGRYMMNLYVLINGKPAFSIKEAEL